MRGAPAGSTAPAPIPLADAPDERPGRNPASSFLMRYGHASVWFELPFQAIWLATALSAPRRFRRCGPADSQEIDQEVCSY